MLRIFNNITCSLFCYTFNGKGRVLHLLWTRYQMDFHKYQTRVKTTLDLRTTIPRSLFTNYIKSFLTDNIIFFKSRTTLWIKKYKKFVITDTLKSQRAIISSLHRKEAARFITIPPLPLTRGSLARDPAINPSPSSPPAFPTYTFPLETDRSSRLCRPGRRDQAGKSDRGREFASPPELFKQPAS